MKFRTVLERIVVAILGVLFALCLLEAGLRISGKFRRLDLHKLDLPQKQSGETRVLFVGDSFVEGVGLKNHDTDTMSAQLEALVKQGKRSKSFRAVNGGRAGENLYQIRMRLAEYAEQVKPDLVVLLGGYIQEEQYYGYYRYLYPHNALTRVLDLLNSSSVVKLYRYIRTDINSKKWLQYEQLKKKPLAGVFTTVEAKRHAMLSDSFADRGDIDKAVEELKAALADEPENMQGYFRLVYLAQDTPRRDRVLPAIYERFKTKIAFGDEMYWHLGEIYVFTGQYDRAFEALKAGVRTDLAGPGYNRCYRGLLLLYRNCRDAALRRKIRRYLLLNFYRDLNSFAVFLDFNRFDVSIDGWSEYEILQTVEWCRKRSIPIVLQTYPEERHPQERRMNALLRRVADSRKVPLVDQQKLLSGIPRERLISGDDIHCSKNGCFLMAKNLLEYIKREFPSLITK